jgi:biotin carboxyl carrier protein
VADRAPTAGLVKVTAPVVGPSGCRISRRALLVEVEEVMTVFDDVAAPAAGTVTEVPVENGALVARGRLLPCIRPTGTE